MVKDIFAYMEYLGSRYNTGLESFEKIIKSKLNISLDDLEAKINDKILSDIDRLEYYELKHQAYKQKIDTFSYVIEKLVKRDKVDDVFENIAFEVDLFFMLEIRPIAIEYKKNILSILGIHDTTSLKRFVKKDLEKNKNISNVTLALLYNILIDVTTPPHEVPNIVMCNEKLGVDSFSRYNP